MNWTIYCLRENSGRIRYFGITRFSLNHRWTEHINERRTVPWRTKKLQWMDDCYTKGITISPWVIATGLSHTRALKLEKMLIKIFYNSFGLVNSVFANRRKKTYRKPSTNANFLLRILKKQGWKFKINITDNIRNKRKQVLVYRHIGLVRTSDGQSARQFCRGLEHLFTKSD